MEVVYGYVIHIQMEMVYGYVVQRSCGILDLFSCNLKIYKKVDGFVICELVKQDVRHTLVVSYPDPSFHSSGWITSPLATFRVAVM